MVYGEIQMEKDRVYEQEESSGLWDGQKVEAESGVEGCRGSKAAMSSSWVGLYGQRARQKVETKEYPILYAPRATAMQV